MPGWLEAIAEVFPQFCQPTTAPFLSVKVRLAHHAAQKLSWQQPTTGMTLLPTKETLSCCRAGPIATKPMGCESIQQEDNEKQPMVVLCY